MTVLSNSATQKSESIAGFHSGTSYNAFKTSTGVELALTGCFKFTSTGVDFHDESLVLEVTSVTVPVGPTRPADTRKPGEL